MGEELSPTIKQAMNAMHLKSLKTVIESKKETISREDLFDITMLLIEFCAKQADLESRYFQQVEELFENLGIGDKGESENDA